MPHAQPVGPTAQRGTRSAGERDDQDGDRDGAWSRTPHSPARTGKYSSTASRPPISATASTRTPQRPGCAAPRRRPRGGCRPATRRPSVPWRLREAQGQRRPRPGRSPTLTQPDQRVPADGVQRAGGERGRHLDQQLGGGHPAVDPGVAVAGADRGQPVVDQGLARAGDQRAGDAPDDEAEREGPGLRRRRPDRRTRPPAGRRPGRRRRGGTTGRRARPRAPR